MLKYLIIAMLAKPSFCTNYASRCDAGSVVVVGLNPALQRTISLSTSLEVGSVNRASSVQVGIGGKGQDVIVAAASMGAKKSPLLLQFLGNGAEGDALAALLQNLTGLDKTLLKTESDALSIRTSTPCRTCVTIVDSVRGEATEIVEPSGKVLQEEVNTLLQILDLQFADQKACGVAVMGSMPPGCSLDLYSSILRRICNSKTKVLLDTATGIFESLASCSDLGCDVVLKLNARELCKLAGVETVAGSEESSATPTALLLKGCAHLAYEIKKLGNGNAQNRVFAAITDGPFPSTFIPLSTQYPPEFSVKVVLPALPRAMVNPIGAGDAVSSGTLMRWCRNVPCIEDQESSYQDLSIEMNSANGDGGVVWREVADAFSWGLSCGSASCLDSANSVFALDDAEGFYRGARFSKI